MCCPQYSCFRLNTVYLYYYEGYSGKEIGALLKNPHFLWKKVPRCDMLLLHRGKRLKIPWYRGIIQGMDVCPFGNRAYLGI